MHDAVAHFSAVSLQRHRTRRAYGFAGGDMEGAEMQVAFDDIAIEFALGQARQAMRASVIGGIDGALDVVERDGFTIDLKLLDGIGGQLLLLADTVTGFTHMHTPDSMANVL